MYKDYKYDPKIIHETVIRDIIDVIDSAKDSDEVQLLMNRKKSWRSIASASSNLVLVFPVVASENCNIETATMITKAVERKAVSMLQILFSAVAFTDAKDAFDYIKKFHTNLKFDNKMDINDFIDSVDKLAEMGEATIIDPVKYLYAQQAIKEDMQNINNVLDPELNSRSLGRFSIGPDYFGNEVISEAISSEEKDLANLVGGVVKSASTFFKSKSDRSSSNSHDDSLRRRESLSKIDKDKTDFYQKQLIPSDVRKANELVPTMMAINFISNTDNNTPLHQQAIIGVKAKLYPVSSADMLNRIVLKNQDRNGLLKLVKATTREISFCKDFLFAIDKIKMDALSQSKKGKSSELWKLLERRALKSKFRRTLSHTNDASAISTMVITQEEVEYLKKMENIDISKPNVIRPIMESYNLMGFCIVDEVLEIAKFIWDTGDDIYESLSFTNLEKENSSNDYKKIINLMTKVSR